MADSDRETLDLSRKKAERASGLSPNALSL